MSQFVDDGMARVQELIDVGNNPGPAVIARAILEHVEASYGAPAAKATIKSSPLKSKTAGDDTEQGGA